MKRSGLAVLAQREKAIAKAKAKPAKKQSARQFVRSQSIDALLDMLAATDSKKEEKMRKTRERTLMAALAEFLDHQGYDSEVVTAVLLNTAAGIFACELEEEASRRRMEEGGNR
jgi:predicted NAD/FAD-binding protein